MISKEISFKDARQRAEQCLQRELFKIGIHPLVPLLEERYVENSVCWIFFRNRAINIPVEYELKLVAGAAYAISKWGGGLMVKDNLDDDAQLKIQMDRFESIHPAVNPNKFSSVWGIPAPNL